MAGGCGGARANAFGWSKGSRHSRPYCAATRAAVAAIVAAIVVLAADGCNAAATTSPSPAGVPLDAASFDVLASGGFTLLLRLRPFDDVYGGSADVAAMESQLERITGGAALDLTLTDPATISVAGSGRQQQQRRTAMVQLAVALRRAAAVLRRLRIASVDVVPARGHGAALRASASRAPVVPQRANMRAQSAAAAVVVQNAVGDEVLSSNKTTWAPNTTWMPNTTVAPNTTFAPVTTTMAPTWAPNTTWMPNTTVAPNTTWMPNTTVAPNTTWVPDTTTAAPVTTSVPPSSYTEVLVTFTSAAAAANFAMHAPQILNVPPSEVSVAKAGGAAVDVSFLGPDAATNAQRLVHLSVLKRILLGIRSIIPVYATTTTTAAPPATYTSVRVVFTSNFSALIFAGLAPDVLNVSAADMTIDVVGSTATVSFLGPDAATNAQRLVHLSALQRILLGIWSITPVVGPVTTTTASPSSTTPSTTVAPATTSSPPPSSSTGAPPIPPPPPTITTPSYTEVRATFDTEANAAQFKRYAPQILNVPSEDLTVYVSGVDVDVTFHGPNAAADAERMVNLPQPTRTQLGIRTLAPVLPATPAPPGSGGGDDDAWKTKALYGGVAAAAVLVLGVSAFVVIRAYRRSRRPGTSGADGMSPTSIQFGGRDTSTSWELGSTSWADGTHTPSAGTRQEHYYSRL